LIEGGRRKLDEAKTGGGGGAEKNEKPWSKFQKKNMKSVRITRGGDGEKEQKMPGDNIKWVNRPGRESNLNLSRTRREITS